MSEFEGALVDQMLADDAYAELLGIQLVSVTSGQITVALDVVGQHLNFLGVGHGGLIFSLADCAFSLGSNSAGDRAVAIDTHFVLTAPARVGDRLEARVTEASRGRTIGTYRVDVSRQDGRTVGLFTGTVHITPDS